MNPKNIKKKARAYALKNALAYGGKAQVGAVLSGLFHEGSKKEDVKRAIKEINEIVKEINSLTLNEQANRFQALKETVSQRHVREGLSELPNAKRGKVVMRISPAPSGPMHIGNALVAALNFLYAQKYSGKFCVRIEDTNPENIYKPAYALIKQDAKWLFGNKTKIVIQSKRMTFYYKYAEKLLKKGTVYVCTCASEDFKEEYVNKMKPCPCRGLSVQKHLARWKKMLSKKEDNYKEGVAVLRFKSSMTDKNPAMRDFPLARINEAEHPLQKHKYRVWPLMNLAVAVDDIDMRMTHIIRGKDHMDNAKRQCMIFNALGKKCPWTAFLGRFKFKDFKLSKTKIRQGIEQGKYKGWDDPALPTISSLRKQGYKKQAFLKFAEHIGLSENDKVMGKEDYLELLDTFNK